MERIDNRRARKPAEKLQLWVNSAAVVLLAVPMAIESLKGLMPPDFYGWTSSIVAVLNMGIGVWRVHVNHGRVNVE